MCHFQTMHLTAGVRPSRALSSPLALAVFGKAGAISAWVPGKTGAPLLLLCLYRGIDKM